MAVTLLAITYLVALLRATRFDDIHLTSMIRSEGDDHPPYDLSDDEKADLREMMAQDRMRREMSEEEEDMGLNRLFARETR